MPTCPVCGSPAATIEDLALTQKRVHCSNCMDFTMPEELLNDPELASIGHLSQALRQQVFCGNPCHLPDINAARQVAGWFVVQNPAEREIMAVEALVKAGDVENPWAEPPQAVGRSLGLSPADSRAFVEDMEKRNVVRYEPCPRQGGPWPGAGAFPQLGRWVRCRTKEEDANVE